MTEHPVRLDEVWSFCTARLDDTEATARRVGFGRIEVGDYLWESKYLILQRDDGGESKVTTELDAELAVHVALHDPQRILADVAFKRRLLAEHEPSLVAAVEGSEVTPMTVCRVDGDTCPFTQGLAALDHEHPDFKESWRP